MNKKIIAGSALTILMCSSLITGATMALFTSESTTNITVSSGKVQLTSTIVDGSVYTKQKDSDYVEGTENTYGGSVTVESSGEVALNNFMPGDGVRFTINVDNDSTVAIQYRAKVVCETENALFNQLDIDFDMNREYWTTVEVGGEIDPIVVTIELPASVTGTEYQGVKCDLAFVVEAVQGNAQTSDIVATVGDKSEMQNTLDQAKPGEEVQITLNDSVELTNEQFVVPENVSVVIDGNGQTITSNSRTFFNNAASDGITLDGVGKDAKICVRNVHFVGPGDGSGYAVILGPRDIGNAEVVFEGCTFEDMYSAVYCTAVDNSSVNITIKDCKFIDTNFGYAIDKSLTNDFANPETFKENIIFTGNTSEFSDENDNNYFIESAFDTEKSITNVGTVEGLKGALENVKAGDTVVVELAKDTTIDLEGTHIELPVGLESITINGNGATISSSTREFFNGNSESNLDGVGQDAKIYISNVNFVGPGNGSGYAVILGPSDIGNAEVVLEKCTFKDMWCAVYCTAVDNASVTITINECTFTNTEYGYSIDTTTALDDPTTFTSNVTFTNNSGEVTESEFGAN